MANTVVPSHPASMFPCLCPSDNQRQTTITNAIPAIHSTCKNTHSLKRYPRRRSRHDIHLPPHTSPQLLHATQARQGICQAHLQRCRSINRVLPFRHCHSWTLNGVLPFLTESSFVIRSSLIVSACLSWFVAVPPSSSEDMACYITNVPIFAYGS